MSSLILNIEDGSTIASTNIYGEKVYINIGSGNVFKLKWGPLNDTVDHYTLILKRYDPTLNVYYDILNKNIGLVNEFYVDSPLLPALPEQYMLSIYLVAYGKQGSVITSNVITPYVCKGSGTYVKAQPTSYAQPIMKRAAAFAKATLPEKTTARIVDTDGNEVFILYGEENPVPVEATRLLTSNTGWQLVSESYVKAPDGAWHAADINYEVLVVQNKETNKFEPLEVLNDERTDYEQLYIL